VLNCCLIIWRQTAFFGDTLAHVALPGIALAMLAGERRFAADHKVIEITGMCASCRDS
jgi:ABC-type Mn2+/Zn2+ transport system permease subunit